MVQLNLTHGKVTQAKRIQFTEDSVEFWDVNETKHIIDRQALVSVEDSPVPDTAPGPLPVYTRDEWNALTTEQRMTWQHQAEARFKQEFTNLLEKADGLTVNRTYRIVQNGLADWLEQYL